MHTGDLLVELLAGYRLHTIFGVPGGQTCALYDAIARRPDIRHISLRDERSAAFAADAFARVTGKVGVCDVTVGPGAVKLPSGLVEAYNTSIPILCIVSEVQSDWLHLYPRGAASQAMQQERLLDGLCGYVATLRQPEQLPGLLRVALRQATANRPAPVAVIVPHEVFDRKVQPEQAAIAEIDPRLTTFPSIRPAPAAEDVQQAARLLAQAHRPILLAGGGAVTSKAFEETRRLAEHLSMPVLSTFTGRGIIEDHHPLALGLVGNVGLRCTRRALEEADVVLLVGFKSAQNSTFNWSLPRRDQTVIHLDVDAAEIGKVFPTAVGMVGDARLGLSALRESVTGTRPSELRQSWTGDLKECRRIELATQSDSDAVPILPQRVMAELARVTTETDLVVCDASYVSGWGTIYYPIRRPGRVILSPRGSAALGFALPAGIGAACARPNSRIIVLSGDGGFSYSLGDLATAVRYRLNVKCLVFNNHSLAWIEHWHRLYFAGASGEPMLLNAVDFAQVAQGFGCRAERVEGPAQLASALMQCLEQDGPAVLDIRTSRDATPLPSYADALSKAKSVTSYLG